MSDPLEGAPSSMRIADVIVGERLRKDYGNLAELMESIRERGLLQPIGVMPDSQLLFGGRRLEAYRRLGHDTIPFVRTRTREDAISRLKAERDENTCRKDMTPEELVDVGLQLEELEAPKAKERQAEAGRTFGRGKSNSSGPSGPELSKSGTAEAVGKALGLSRNTYKRAKHVVQTARGDIDAEPEAKEVAQKALADMNAEAISITGAYERVRKARSPKPVEKPKAPPRYGGNRRKHLQIIDALAASASGMAVAAAEITVLDQTVTSEEAARLRGDLSKSVQSLRRLINLLKERTQ